MKTGNTYDQRPPDCDLGPTILVVDDESDGRERLVKVLQTDGGKDGYHVLVATSLEEALSLLATGPVHVVLLDKNLGGAMDGISCIPEMLQLQPHVQVLMVTGSNSVGDIVSAMRNGAFGYVTKDTQNSLLSQQIEKAISMAELSLRKVRDERRFLSSESQCDFVTESRAAKSLVRQVEAVAESNRPVLLLGETGTGKTTIAKYIHEYRKRYLKQKDRPFFSVNISAFSSTLVEGELFGSEKGAFTGALKTRPGFFELANSGTLFLDEIGEISEDVQRKLLTVLDGGSFFRVGGTKELRSSFKLICATNQDLKALVAAGKFREDLYMRISTFAIEVPALSERKEDIPGIVAQILPKACRENKVYLDFEQLPPDFLESLCENIPAGNIRGLEQQISRLLVFSPKDTNGKPILKNWRSIPGLLTQGNSRTTRSRLSLKEMMSLPLDVIGADFPGLGSFIDSIEERVLLDAKSKLSQNRKIARALKLSDSAVGARLKRLEIKLEHRNPSSRATEAT